MPYVLGVEMGLLATSWVGAPLESADVGLVGDAMASVVAPVDGGLVAGRDAQRPGLEVTDRLIERLGDPAPVVLGGVPYGADALLGVLAATVLRDAPQRLGSAPTTIAVVLPAGFDTYRQGLLVEALRSSGAPMAQVVLVPEPVAAQLGARVAAVVPPGQVLAAGAALAARGDDPSVRGALILAGSIGAVAGGAATAVAGSGAPTAVAAGPGVTAAGPVGTPLAAPAVGPAGVPVGPSPVGPAGAPLPAPAAGPAGAPVGVPPSGPAGLPVEAPVSPHRPPAQRVIPKKLPIVVGATVAVGAAGAAVVVATQDDSPSAKPPATPAVVTTSLALLPVLTEPASTVVVTTVAPTTTEAPTTVPDTAVPATTVPDTAPATTLAATTAPAGGVAPGVFDVTPLLGTWQFCQADSGSTGTIEFAFTAAGPNRVQVHFSAWGAPSGGCPSPKFAVVNDTTDEADVVSATTSGGTTVVQLSSGPQSGTATVTGDQLVWATASDSLTLTRVAG